VNSPGLEAGPCGERATRRALDVSSWRTFLKFRSSMLSCWERGSVAAWIAGNANRNENAVEDFMIALRENV